MFHVFNIIFISNIHTHSLLVINVEYLPWQCFGWASVSCWLGYLSGAGCRLFACGLANATALHCLISPLSILYYSEGLMFYLCYLFLFLFIYFLLALRSQKQRMDGSYVTNSWG